MFVEKPANCNNIFENVLYIYLRGKLDPWSIKCIFVGYSRSHKRYKCYCPSLRKMYVTLDVVFDEQYSYYENVSIPTDLSQKENKFWSLIDIVNNKPVSIKGNIDEIQPDIKRNQDNTNVVLEMTTYH